jgi:F0F1-type ATP synthase membrane subunit b/b'
MLEDRQAAIDKARQQSDTLVKEAQAGLAAEVARSEKELLAACQSLGRQIAVTVLGTPLGEG